MGCFACKWNDWRSGTSACCEGLPAGKRVNMQQDVRHLKRLTPITAPEPQRLARFATQMALPGMSPERQKKLSKASVVIIGLSAAGTACAFHLAQAGVARLSLIDPGTCELADLSSHHLLNHEDIGLLKCDAVKKNLERLFPDVEVTAINGKFDAHNAERVLAGAQIAVEALENWQEKLVASDMCMHLAVPLIHSGLIAFSFHVFSMIPGKSACLRCVFLNLGLEDFPLHQPGVLGAIAGLVGSFQATEAIKMITQLGTISGNHLLRFDVLRCEFDDMTQLTGRSDCPDCGRWK